VIVIHAVIIELQRVFALSIKILHLVKVTVCKVFPVKCAICIRRSASGPWPCLFILLLLFIFCYHFGYLFCSV